MAKELKTCLITGITGQDGAYLAQFLLAQGYDVIGLLAEEHTHSLGRLAVLGFADKVRCVSCRLTDSEALKRVLLAERPQEIYNLAAFSSVGASFQEPVQCLHFNVLSVAALLEAVRAVHFPVRVYQASSSEMFGNTASAAHEATPLNPISPYAVSKVAGHLLIRNYRAAHHMYCCSGILFNHESVLRPEHFVTKKILSTAVRIARGSREPLRLGNIAVKRDWGYAPEYVKAMWLMLQQPDPEDFVIASGVSHSIKDFVDQVFRELGLDWHQHVQSDPSLYRAADIAVTLGDPARARKIMGWNYALSLPDLVKKLVADELRAQAAGSV